MKICVFGAGAIGAFLAYHVARGGAELSLVARGEHLAALRKNGLRMITAEGDDTIKLPASDHGREFGVQDFLIIALKAHTIDASLATMAPLVGRHTTVVTAYNGLPFWFFRRGGAVPFPSVLESVDPGARQWHALGSQPAIGCVVLPATEIVSPGVIRHDHGRRFPIGSPDALASRQVQQLSEILIRGGLEAPIRSDIRDEIWLKLWGNLCLNPIALLTEATVDRIATDPGTRALCEAMMAEAEAIGATLGLRLRVTRTRRLDGAAALGPHKMSMLQDLEHGRTLEIDPLVGVIQEMGRAIGVATPATDLVLALARLRARTAEPRASVAAA